MKTTKIVLHYDSFTIESKPNDRMDLCRSSDPLASIAYGLHCLVYCEQDCEEGDTFFLPAQSWNKRDLPETTWTVCTLPNGLPGIAEYTRFVRTFHVHCAEMTHDEWVIVDSFSGDTMTIQLDWGTNWDGWVWNFSKLFFEKVNLHPGDVVAFHSFHYHHPDIPGINRLLRFVFLPVYQHLEPLTADDEWNPDIDCK